MRLPFPTRISIQKMFLFAAVVFLAQQLEGTSFIFSLLFFAFLMLSTLTFNFARGFSRASGTYVFWFALLTCILGVLWKIVLGEPGDSNLVSPAATMSAYVISMGAILGSLFVSHQLIGNPRGVPAIVKVEAINLGLASLGCLLMDEILSVVTGFMPHGSGSLANILGQLNIFLPLSILLGTVYTIRKTGGRRSVNVVTLISGLIIFVFGGLIYYSKQGMFTPIVCWGVAAASQRYRVRPRQMVFLIAFAIYSVTVLTPLSEVARGVIGETGADNWQRLELSADLLSHPLKLRAEYLGQAAPGGVYETSTTGFAQSYFNSPQGLLDRLNMIQVDDRLITFTLRGNQDGYQRFIFYFINWIPHFIYPNKEKYAPPEAGNAGNYYAHEMGAMITPQDVTTGISFSPTGEAFHMEGWLGLLTLGPIAWTLLFAVVDLVCGDLRSSPFGLMAVVAFAHIAPEGLLGSAILFIWIGDLAIVVAIFFCAYFAPVLGELLAGSADSRSALANTASLPIPSA